jgi:adenylate kinase
VAVSSRIVLLGPPGAGKGTQAKRLAKSAGVAHVASGDLFRRHQGEGTELGKLAGSYMKKGELVPDEVVIRMVLERIQEPDARGGYILDGFPRTHEQAEALDRALAQEGVRIDEVPLVEVETEELVRRLAGRWICSRCQTPYHQETAPPAKPGECDACGGELYQRPDDRPEAVRRRLEVYEEQTTPLVRYYERQGKLRRVNGQQKIEQVAADLRKALGE